MIKATESIDKSILAFVIGSFLLYIWLVFGVITFKNVYERTILTALFGIMFFILDGKIEELKIKHFKRLDNLLKD